MSQAQTQLKERFYQRLAELKVMSNSTDQARLPSLYQRLATNARHFHMHDICLECYDYLSKYYLIIDRNGNKLKAVNERLEFHEYVISEDRRIRKKILLIENEYQLKRVYTKESVDEIESFLDGIELKIEYGPYIYQKYYYLKNLHFSMKGDYEGVITNGLDAYEFFEHEFIQMNATRFKYLVRVADAHYVRREYDQAMGYLDICSGIEIAKKTEYHNYLITRSRVMLSQGLDVYELLSNWTENAQEHQFILKEMILIYNDLLNGRPIDDFSLVSKYRFDPGGLGVSLMVAKMWSCRLRDDHYDKKESVRRFGNSYLKNRPRCRSILEFIINKSSIDKDQLNIGVYNGEIEIIPYELIYMQISRLG